MPERLLFSDPRLRTVRRSHPHSRVLPKARGGEGSVSDLSHRMLSHNTRRAHGTLYDGPSDAFDQLP